MTHKDPMVRAAYQKAYRASHQEQAKAYRKAYWEAHRKERKILTPAERKEKRNKYIRGYYATHKDQYKARRLAHQEQRRAVAKLYVERLRKTVLDHYGGKCTCCGETEPHFLCIDHINGGGSQHRKIIGGGKSTYKWLIANNYPEGFQVLCHNCNMAKGFYGICPHKLEKEKQNVSSSNQTTI